MRALSGCELHRELATIVTYDARLVIAGGKPRSQRRPARLSVTAPSGVTPSVTGGARDSAARSAVCCYFFDFG
jgi:hypothetical protein